MLVELKPHKTSKLSEPNQKLSQILNKYHKNVEMSMEPDCAVFPLEPDYPNCSLVLNWIGPGLILYRLGYIISPFKKHFHFISLATHSQSRLNSFQTVKTLFCNALPGHLDFTSFLSCALFLAGED